LCPPPATVTLGAACPAEAGHYDRLPVRLKPDATGTATPLFDNGVVGGISGGPLAAPTRLPLPPTRLMTAEFLKVEISAEGAPVPAWERPVSVYFRRAGDGWRLVGLERLP
jgi:hypothetical protein